GHESACGRRHPGHALERQRARATPPRAHCTGDNPLRPRRRNGSTQGVIRSRRRKLVRLRLISLLALIAVAVPAVALASHAKQLEFEAYLLGKSEIPKVAPAGKATAKITITGTKVCWKFLAVKGIDKPVVAHIHKGG